MSAILTANRRGKIPQGDQASLARALIAYCGRYVKFISKGWALSIWCAFKLLASEYLCRCRRFVTVAELVPDIVMSWADST